MSKSNSNKAQLSDAANKSPVSSEDIKKEYSLEGGCGGKPFLKTDEACTKIVHCCEKIADLERQWAELDEQIWELNRKLALMGIPQKKLPPGDENTGKTTERERLYEKLKYIEERLKVARQNRQQKEQS